MIRTWDCIDMEFTWMRKLFTDHLPFILHGSLVGACFFEMGKDVRGRVLRFNAMCWTLLNSSDLLGFSLLETLQAFCTERAQNQSTNLDFATAHWVPCLLVPGLFGVFGLWEKVHCFCSLHSIITTCLETIHKSSPWMTPKSGSFHDLYCGPFFGCWQTMQVPFSPILCLFCFPEEGRREIPPWHSLRTKCSCSQIGSKPLHGEQTFLSITLWREYSPKNVFS